MYFPSTSVTKMSAAEIPPGRFNMNLHPRPNRNTLLAHSCFYFTSCSLRHKYQDFSPVYSLILTCWRPPQYFSRLFSYCFRGLYYTFSVLMWNSIWNKHILQEAYDVMSPTVIIQGAAERTPLFEKQINSRSKNIRQIFFYFWKAHRMPFYINVF